MKPWYVVVMIFLSLTPYALTQNNNPFTIERKDSLIPAQDVDSVTKEDQSDQEVIVEGDNPFSVSHIPIRKNQYEQIEQLKINDSAQKENISIGFLPLWVIVLSLCLLSFILIKKKNHIYTLLKTLLNSNFLRLIAYEQNAGLSMAYLSGYFLFIVNLSLFLFLVIGKAFYIGLDIAYWWLLILMLTYHIGKHIVIVVFSKLYEFEKEARIYSFTIITLNNFLALFFLSLNVIILFGPDNWTRLLALAGIFIFIIFLFSRYYKGLVISRKYINDNFFHFFLYFCAFEFSPWLIIYSLLRDLN